MEAVSRHLRRRFGLVLLALAALAALIDARGIAAIVAAQLVASPIDYARGAPSAPPAPPDAHATSADALLRNNPFDSTARPEPAVEPSDAPPACDGYRPQIIVAAEDPEASLVSLSVPGEAKPLLRRPGGAAGDRFVAFVGLDRVWLRSRAGTLCQALLWRAPAAPQSSVQVTPPVRGALEPAIAKGIERVGPREYRIDRATVDRIVDQYAELMKGTTVAPDKENGRPVGVRLFGIRPESVLGVLGLENGDRLVTINGLDVTDPSAALQAMGFVRTAPRLDVAIVRAGKTTSIVYEVR